jgi:hypothetical protein
MSLAMSPQKSKSCKIISLTDFTLGHCTNNCIFVPKKIKELYNNITKGLTLGQKIEKGFKVDEKLFKQLGSVKKI